MCSVIVAQEPQTREPRTCSWHSEKTTGRTSRCGHAFITHITGQCTEGSGSVWETPHPLRSEARYEGSQIKEAHVLWAPLNFITSLCKRSRSSHRTRSCSPKETRRELQSIPKTIHIPSGQGPSGQPPVVAGGRAMSTDHTLHPNMALPPHVLCAFLPIGDLCGDHAGTLHPYTTDTVKATPQD